MAFIELSIVEPRNNAAIAGATAVNFRGSVSSLPPEAKDVALYYRWYSSLNTEVKKEKYSMNANALTSADSVYTHPAMDIGSHVIAFAVSDRPGEKNEDFDLIRHGGVTGGRNGNNPCVIHVFKANIISPQDVDGDSVSRANLVLKAEAPSAWLDDHYHEVNRLSYRWVLEPVGDPAGRQKFDSKKLGRDKLAFKAEPAKLPTVTYTFTPALPATATGQYRIILFVVDKNVPEIGQHQASLIVTLTG